MSLLKNNSVGSTPNFSGFNGGFQQGVKATNSLINSGERGYDRHRKNQALDAMGKAWASGEPAQFDAAMSAFPEYIGQMQKQMGIRDDQHRKELGSMTAKLHGLLNADDTEGAKALVQQNASLFDKEGPYSAQGVAGMIDSGDEKALQRLDNWAQSTTLGSLTPLEIIKEGDAQQRFNLDRQRMAQNYDLGQRRLAQNFSLAQQRIGMQGARLGEMQRYHDLMLNRGTPGEREWSFFNGLSPEEKQQYLSMKRGPGAGGGLIGGFQNVKLSNGQTLQIDPKVHGAGSNAFYQGRDGQGNLVNVPVSSVVTPISSSEAAGQEGMNNDLSKILSANQDDLDHITGFARGGGTGSMPVGADTYTGYKGGTARDVYNAANRIQGNMQNKGIAAAKSMGASGINTVAEAKLYFQSMPQLDYSSPEALVSSAENIKKYTDEFNHQHGIDYSGTGGKKSVSQMSDAELLKDL